MHRFGYKLLHRGTRAAAPRFVIVNKPIRVLLADDHAMIREGLRVVLETQRGIQVAGQAADGREAVRLAAELRPDVVVMDMRMPQVNGVEATRTIVAAGPAPKVIIVSGFADERTVTEAIRAGASGYVVKDAVLEELAPAIRKVVDGQTYVSPRTAAAAAAAAAAGAAAPPTNDGVGPAD